MVTENAGLFQDESFWVLIATVIFVCIFWVKGRGPLFKFLDSRSDRIKKELDESERLKEEAHDLLANAQKQSREAAKNAQRLINEAKESALLIQKTAEKQLNEDMQRREEQLLARIARAEKQATEDMRDHVANIAAQAAEKLLTNMISGNGEKLVDEAVSSLSSVRITK